MMQITIALTLPMALMLLLVLCGCRATEDRDDNTVVRSRLLSAEYAREINDWHADRIERLRDEDGWLTLVGLAWLEPGDNRVGAGDDDDVSYAGFPVRDVGVISVARGSEGGASVARITFQPAPGVDIDGVPPNGVLASDADGPPTVLSIGSCRMHVIQRGERLGVRIKDRAAPLRAAFTGIDRFATDPQWRIVADFVPHDEQDQITAPVELVIGVISETQVAGRARFSREGQACDMMLEPAGDDDSFFVVFGDETNGRESYGGGRFLIATLTEDRTHVVLDFNRAYNPPCSFSAFATCPLPVADNVLPFAVRAGERRWDD